jgi:hypothetical protein
MVFDIFQDVDGRNADNSDRIEERNDFPEDQPEDKDIAPLHDNVRTKVNFFQVHDHISEFGHANGLMSLYDPDNPDRQLFDCVEQEVISMSSPPILYYKLLHDLQDVDPILGESTHGTRDAYAEPTVIFGNYTDPTPIQELTKYGINAAEELDIWFNYNYLLNTIGDKLQLGDIIMTYDGKLWEVMSSVILNESLWRAQHDNVKVIKLQREGIILPDMPNGIRRIFNPVEC